MTATYGAASYSPSQFVGTTPSYAEARKSPVEAGTFITPQEESQHARVVVLGQTVVANLFGSADPLGQTIKLNGIGFTVVGVLAPKGTNGIQDQDDIVIAPLTTTQDLITGVTERPQPDHRRGEVVRIRSTRPRPRRRRSSRRRTPRNGTANFRVLNQASLLQTTASTNHVFTVLLAAVAAISLLVGGIGVMNIMLVTVTERTREIGIRKAIGARRADILGQFLTEAVLLSVCGGLLGVAAGLVGSRFKIVGVQPVVETYSVLLALAVGVAVGLFFGIYPANRAASLRPIEALRYE